jgi:hypothetical protein
VRISRKEQIFARGMIFLMHMLKINRKKQCGIL